MTGQFVYNHLAITGSPTGVETEKGSERVSGLILNWTTIEGVTKEKVAPGSNNA